MNVKNTGNYNGGIIEETCTGDLRWRESNYSSVTNRGTAVSGAIRYGRRCPAAFPYTFSDPEPECKIRAVYHFK